ncbi:MAG: hypothetical protein QM744_02785 [Mesorhizobium sp.]
MEDATLDRSEVFNVNQFHIGDFYCSTDSSGRASVSYQSVYRRKIDKISVQDARCILSLITPYLSNLDAVRALEQSRNLPSATFFQTCINFLIALVAGFLAFFQQKNWEELEGCTIIDDHGMAVFRIALFHQSDGATYIYLVYYRDEVMQDDIISAESLLGIGRMLKRYEEALNEN